MAAGTYLAARLLGTWELYLLAFAFLAAVLVSWLLVLTTGRRLSATRTLDPSQPTAGEPLTVWFRLRNDSQLPGLQVTLPNAAGDLSARAADVEFPSLGSLQERAIASEPLSAPRGIHHLPALWARAEDPLGLIRLRRRVAEPLDITVYPRLVDLTSCALFADLGARRGLGPAGIARMGATEFRGIRAHQPGEPLNHIDWKATAKTGSLMLREMDDPESGDIAVVLDGTAAGVVGEAPQTSFELAVQAAGSVADYVLPPVEASTWRSTTAAGSRRTWRPTSTATAGCSTPWPRSGRTRTHPSRRRCSTCAAAADGWRPPARSCWSPCRSIAISCARCSHCTARDCECPLSTSSPARSRRP